jgi:hypothetical protein
VPESSSLDERISFPTHHGKAIMLIDCSHLNVKEMMIMLDLIQHTVVRHEKNSLLVLADMNDVHLDRTTAQRMKEVLTLDRPYVKRAAWIGSQSVPKVYVENFKSFSQREFRAFETREEAMDYLVQD